MLHEFQVEDNVHIFLMAHLCRFPTMATCGNDVNDSGMGDDKLFEHPARNGRRGLHNGRRGGVVAETKTQLAREEKNGKNEFLERNAGSFPGHHHKHNSGAPEDPA